MFWRRNGRSAYLALYLTGVLLLMTTCGPGVAGGAKPSLTALRQFRAAWVATVNNIDWPSKPGLPVEVQQREFRKILDALLAMHMNAVVVQIRTNSDAFYPSKYNPWSKYLTGIQGEDPGYDPLAFMLAEAHQRNLEFHAWMNPYRIAKGVSLDALAPDHPARLHPDWVVRYGDGLYYNPGEPEAMSLILASFLEVVQNYDIDAIHMDDYFYPYRIAGQEFPDDATYRKYGAATFANKGDWRRHNINQFVQQLAAGIKRLKPYVRLGVSPFGVWRNQAVDPTGSDTTANQTDYDDLYADTRTWMREGWLDYIVPQIYWNIGFASADYAKLVSWWSHEVEGRHVQLYIGQAAYRIGTLPGPWSNPAEMPNQLEYNARFSNVKGSIFFSIKELLANPSGFTKRLEQDIYQERALIPSMPWLPGTIPAAVDLQSAQQEGQGVALRWSAVPSAAYYAIYRVQDGQDTATGTTSLIGTMRSTAGSDLTYIDATAVSGNTYTYEITALDRLHNQGPAGMERQIVYR